MARNLKTRSKRSLKQRISCIAALEKVNNPRPPLGDANMQTGEDNLYESDNDDL